MNKYSVWFRGVVLFGVLANLFIALIGIPAPNTLIGIVGGEPVIHTIWPSFACVLLLLLSLFYIPAALDPFKHRLAAIYTVIARLAGVVFFLLIHTEYKVFGIFDLVFFVPEAVLLLLAYKQGPD